MTLRFPIDPRMVPPEKVARRLGVTIAAFGEKRPALEAHGFPKPDAVLGNYSLEAVDRWIDVQAGLTPAGGLVSDPTLIEGRIRAKAWAR